MTEALSPERSITNAIKHENLLPYYIVPRHLKQPLLFVHSNSNRPTREEKLDGLCTDY